MVRAVTSRPLHFNKVRRLTVPSPKDTELTRILLADDHPLLRSGLKTLIAEQSDLTVVAEVSDGERLVEAAAAWQPDILILDVEMPDFDPITTTQYLTTTYPDLRILILTAHDDEEYVHGLLGAGALGYVLKEEAPTSLISALRSVAQGKRWLSSRVAHLVAHRALGRGVIGRDGPLDKLTGREREVLALIGFAFTNRAIAHRLVITEKTVENHITSIYSKLDLDNRQHAVRFAIRHGLAEP